MMRQGPGQHRHGLASEDARAFTLLESLVAVLLIGIATTAFAAALVAGLNENQTTVQYVVATNLAAGLMNEIVAKPFADPDTPENTTLGPEAGEGSRGGFDNIDDYDGTIELPGQLRGASGATLSAQSLARYSRGATASYVNVPGRNPALPPAFLLVTVEVKYDDASLVTLKRLISSEERR